MKKDVRMKKFVTAAIFIVALAGSAPALANEGGSCHFHGSKPAPEKVVIDCATQRKALLIKDGKLDKTWETVKHDKVEQVEGKKGKEWKVTFKNPAVSDPAKSTLYVFLSQPGNYIAANFTGQ